MLRRRLQLAFVLIIGVVGATLVATSRLAADPPGGGSPKVFKRDSAPYGTSYGDWAAAWWQWAYSFPADNSPLFDDTGENAGLGQSGPVYFLAGSFGSQEVTRDITVPKGKALFFPILNGEYDNLLCFDPNTNLSILDMRAYVAGPIDHAVAMFCQVDGEAVMHVKKNFRVVTPAMSLYPTADGLCTDEPVGVAVPAVADGYYIMLEPLTVGTHTLHFGGTLPDFDFTIDITYNITVTP